MQGLRELELMWAQSLEQSKHLSEEADTPSVYTLSIKYNWELCM